MSPFGTRTGQTRTEQLPPLPTGMPTGPIAGQVPTPQMPSTMGFQGFQQPTGMGGFMPGMGDLTPITPFNQPVPVTTENILFLNAFLKTVIGRRVTVDFLIGTNTLTDRTGTLLAVGANYIVINEVETDDILICDFFSIKFVKVYY
jgi:hypothetical protein